MRQGNFFTERASAGNYQKVTTLSGLGVAVMGSSAVLTSVRRLRGLLAAQRNQDESDEQLLHAFLGRRDDSAFAVLVRRHGPMVFHVCRRVLGHQQDAEDAFQATFLVLARNAASLRRKTALASFLHGTAYRTAMKAKQSAARRGKHEGRAPARPSVNPADELSWHEVRTLLDEEIARLPEKYRTVFVLCHLENLSQAEAARRLGLNERTLSSRLAEARKQLQMRLSRRGVELTALLAVSVLTTETASALPAVLLTKAIGGAVSPAVAALADSVPTILGVGKAKLAMLLLAASLLGGGGVLVHFQRAAAENGAPPVAEKAKPQPPVAPAAKNKETATFAGSVLDPAGKPIADAKLYVLYYTRKELPIPVRATSDKDGRFRFTIARKDFDQTTSARPWDEAIVVAMANGYGLGLPASLFVKRITPTDPTIQLSKDDGPITGRILDLQGKPVVGVTVGVHDLFLPKKGDLTAWLRDLKEKKEGYPTLRDHLTQLGGLWMGRDLGKVIPPVVTGADGRFRLAGIGRERVAALRLQGPSIVATELFVRTRPGSTIRAAQYRRDAGGDEMIFCGSAFEHVAAPCQPIVGVVRDKDTGKPLPGAVVRSYVFARTRIAGETHLHAVADKEGRYRLTGMPKGEGNELRAEGPDGQPYLMSLARVPKGFALEPVTVDFQLKRGMWIEGAVTDKATGKPVHSIIRWTVFEDNPFRKEAPGLTFEDNMWTRARDGSFRFAALPGRGVVTAQAAESRYLTRVGADRIEGVDRLGLIQPFHTVMEINPAKDAESVRCDIVLDPGRTLSGKVLDSEGRPLAGARVAGLSGTGHWEHEPLRTAAFTVVALGPGETRLLQFSHADKYLAGSLVVRGDAKGPLTVTLGPAGVLTGRFVTRKEKKPLADLEMFADLYGPIANPRMLTKPPDPTIGTFPRSLRTDKDGKFRIEDLATGLKYRIVLHKGMYALFPDGPAGKGVSVEAGETKDLGDVTVKLVE
jgi:RNA polymerase sigma factor (sigma-70 family)